MGIWIDTDMGFDDIAAILVVRHAGIGIDGVSLVFGNAPLEQVRANAAGAVAAFGWRFPIHTGCASSVLGERITAGYALGETGIPTAGKLLPEGPPLHGSDAFDALSQWIERTASPRRVLALGPLTNIAALALARPELAGRIDELVWMGGAVGRGNHTASAEFNAAADPEAVAIVLAHHIPVKMIDLDFCRKIGASPADVLPVRAAGGRNAELIADMLEGFINIAISRGRPAMALYDAAAAFAFIQPAAVGFQPAGVVIELHGALTRGRTVVETRSSHATFNAHYAVEVDAECARATILDALVKEARRP